MAKISINGIAPEKKLFHNEPINVYPTTLPLDKIHFWPENNRTVFTFERLLRLTKKRTLGEIPIEDITKFVAKQDIHQLGKLAESIGRNGVKVPLIITDDGKLLDGNRRYFACIWLEMQCAERKKEVPEFLSRIPVMVIRKVDLKDPTIELKILAEENFLPDFKVDWPLDAQARAVEECYRQSRKVKKTDHETALAEVMGIYGISRQRTLDLLETLEFTERFVNEGVTEDERSRRGEIVEGKFVYFWEFRNKAMKGRGAYEDQTELAEVRNMFFRLMAIGGDSPIKNVKQVEPLAQARRDRTAWSILKDSKGAKLGMVVSMMNEKKEVRKAEDKIRIFYAWLEDTVELTPIAKRNLRQLAKLANDKGQA